jgi:ferredoxin
VKVWIDPDLCTACGLCTDNVPGIFRMGKDYAEAISNEDIPLQFVHSVHQAMDDCPAECIFEKT